MPPALKRQVDKEVKAGDYASVSEFFRDMLRNWNHNRLLNLLKENQKDFESGKYKVLKSLSDLD